MWDGMQWAMGPPPISQIPNLSSPGNLSTNTHRLRRSALAANAFVRCAFAGECSYATSFYLLLRSYVTPVSVARDPPVSTQLGLWCVPISGRPLVRS